MIPTKSFPAPPRDTGPKRYRIFGILGSLVPKLLEAIFFCFLDMTSSWMDCSSGSRSRSLESVISSSNFNCFFFLEIGRALIFLVTFSSSNSLRSLASVVEPSSSELSNSLSVRPGNSSPSLSLFFLELDLAVFTLFLLFSFLLDSRLEGPVGPDCAFWTGVGSRFLGFGMYNSPSLSGYR